MLLNIFKSNQRIAGLGVVFLSVLLWAPGYFKETSAVFKMNPFINVAEGLIGTSWLNVLLTSVLVGGQAIFLNYIINHHKLLKTNNYVVAFFSVLLNGAFYFFFSMNPVVFANTFLLLGLHQIFRLYNLTESIPIIFNAGLFFGIGALMYPPYVVVFPLVLVAVSYLRSPKANDFLIAIIGFIIPFIYLESYFFLTDKQIDVNLIFHPHIIDRPFVTGVSSYFIYSLAIVFFIALLSCFSFLNRTVVKTRKLFVLILLLFALCFPVLIFNNMDYAALYLVLIPAMSIVISNFMINLKKGWQGELFVLLLLGAIVLGYFS